LVTLIWGGGNQGPAKKGGRVPADNGVRKKEDVKSGLPRFKNWTFT